MALVLPMNQIYYTPPASTQSNLNQELTTALSIILPVIYSMIAIIGIIGNIVVFQSICANRFRHKSIHLLVLSVMLSDFCFIFIFTIERAVSYGYLSTRWIASPGQWCKAEMYLLRTFDFVLAYSVVFMCLDRAVGVTSCWFSVRKLRSGISIVISIWLASAYILIPILLFKQTIYVESYGGFFCQNLDSSVTLDWLGNYPRRVLDFVDIVFRVYVPIFFMLIFLFAASVQTCIWNSKKNKNKRLIDYNTIVVEKRPGFTGNNNYVHDLMDESSIRHYNNRLYSMVLSYAIIFALCQLPYETYRAALLCDIKLEKHLLFERLDFSIEIPLLLLKLINRCINPYLFICLGDYYGNSRNCCRLWCLSCLPGCMGCSKCWCYDCCKTLDYETSYCLGKRPAVNDDLYVPTGLQTVSTFQYKDGDRLVTKQKILEEYETGVEPYYKNPKMREQQQNANGGLFNQAFHQTDTDNYNLQPVKSKRGPERIQF